MLPTGTTSPIAGDAPRVRASRACAEAGSDEITDVSRRVTQSLQALQELAAMSSELQSMVSRFTY